MKIYLVGGAVRDQLLNIPVKDRDWVVVGASSQDLLSKHYIPVGKDFPVFLHPKTKEEYALARTERKSGTGYTGFQCISSPDITLEEDLLRRDLTINAIAQDPDGTLIDPFHGQQDLKQRVLRHVSPAFREDPLRLLRVARFAARFGTLGFRVADDTLSLMRQIVADNELQYLPAERLWSEIQRALAEPTPTRFFEVLRDCGALQQILPEIDALFGVPQPEQHHPEIDTGIHTLMSLTQAAQLSPSPLIRFAVLTHDLGKGTTPESEWPRHIAHEQRSVGLIDQLAKRLRIPRDYHKLAKNVARFHTHCHRAFELRPETLIKTLEELNAYRQPEHMDAFLLVCEADARGRSGFETRPYPQADWFRSVLKATSSIDVPALQAAGFEGKALGNAIHQQRITLARHLRENHAINQQPTLP